jgi:hypothetical protein
MAVYAPLSSPQPKYSFAAQTVSTTIIDPRDFMNKPDVYQRLVQKNPMEHQDLLWMDKMGMVKKMRVSAETPLHQESNKKYSTGAVVSFAQLGGGATATNPNNNAISVVFEGPYSPDGKDSYFRAGERIEFATSTRLQGYIVSIDKTTDFAHKINITPVNDPTLSYANFSALISVGMGFFVINAPGGEKSSVISDTLVPTFTMFESTVEKCSETSKFTFKQMTNESWIKYKDKDGVDRESFWHNILGDMWIRFFAKRELACLVGQGQANRANLPVDVEGNPYYTTEGFITSCFNRGATQLSTGPEVTIDLIEDIARVSMKNNTGNKALMWGSQDLVFKFNRFGMSAGANGGVIYDQGDGSKKIIAKFTDFGLGDYELEVKQLNCLSHAGALGIPGTVYNGLGVVMPKSEAIVLSNVYGEGNMQGERTLPFTMLYKECSGENGGMVGRGDYMYLTTGGLSPHGSTQLKDNLEIGMISHFAARTARTDEMMLVGE